MLQGRKDIVLVKNKNQGWVHNFPLNSLIELTATCIEANRYNEAAHYLAMVKAQPIRTATQRADIVYNESLLQAKLGNYKQAYLLSAGISDTLKNLNTKKLVEFDKLLDAFTESEETHEKLNASEKEKATLYQRVIYFSLLLGLILFTGLIVIRQRNKKFRQKIQQLNYAVEIQVARLEEMTFEAKQTEKRHLGMELHDNVASELAALVFLTENQLQETRQEDNRMKKNLRQINSSLKHIYQKVRETSHDLVTNSESVRDEAFTKRTAIFLDEALPDKKYTKEIMIDDDSLVKLNVESRIELLRILQEAIINILKHARAKTVSILIYEDDGNVILNIRDDGRGFDTTAIEKKGSGLGLKSIRKRVASLRGQFDIVSGKKGTEINVSVPIQAG